MIFEKFTDKQRWIGGSFLCTCLQC